MEGVTYCTVPNRLEADFEALLISLRATPSLIEKHARGAATASERDRKAWRKNERGSRLQSQISNQEARSGYGTCSREAKVREGDVQPRLDRLRETREDFIGVAPGRDGEARRIRSVVARIADIAVVVRDAARLWRRARTAGDVAGQQALARTVFPATRWPHGPSERGPPHRQCYGCARRSGGPKPRKRSGPLALFAGGAFRRSELPARRGLDGSGGTLVVAVLGYLIAHAHVSAKHPFHRSQRVVFWNSLLGRHIAPHPDILDFSPRMKEVVAA